MAFGRGRGGNTGNLTSLGSGRTPGQTGSLSGLTMPHGSYGSGRGTLGNTGDKTSLGTMASPGDSGSQSGSPQAMSVRPSGTGMGFAATPFNPMRFIAAADRKGIPKKQKGAASGQSMHGLKAAAKAISGHGNSWGASKGTNKGTGTTTTGPMADSPPHYNGGKG
jgi:hypothetical protein